MRFIRSFLPAMLLVGSAITIFAQPNFSPPPAAQKIDAATLQRIEASREQLRREISSVSKANTRAGYADVAVYLKALEWITRHNEWIGKDIDKQTLRVAEEGLRRVKRWQECLATGGELLAPTGNVVVARGYLSGVDGSVQPYAVSYPADYGTDKKKAWRVDISLHGRDSTLTEVKHLAMNGKATPVNRDYVEILIYGRGNNAYRWAGEEDVLEVWENFVAGERARGRAGCLDHARVVLKGFSMGGAGTWHLGLHHPHRWAVMQPGAGFTTTHGYIDKNPDAKFPSPVEEMLTIYDAVNYAGNARMVPLVAYSGEIDGQKKAADNIEAALKTLGLPMTHIIAPGLAHVAPQGEFTTRIETEFIKYLGPGKGKAAFPDEVHFVTHTLKYPRAASWITLLGLEEHYRRASLDAVRRDQSCVLKTTNITSFELSLKDTPFHLTQVTVDDQALSVPSGRTLWFEKTGAKWRLSRRNPVHELAFPGRKASHLRGPIDDAFTSGFVCVPPATKGFDSSTDAAATFALARFGQEWDKYLRGTLLVKTATEIRDADLAKNLILFGDPASNPLIKRIVAKLPLKWTPEKVVLAGQEFLSRDHLPVMIYPNPYSKGKSYVVINSGHSFGAPEFEGSNAQLYPRLGDYAVLKWDAGAKRFTTVLNGLFDEAWQVKAADAGSRAAR